MAIRQRKAPAEKPAPKIEEASSSEDEEIEQEYHTEPSDDEEEPEPQHEEYHTDPEDASRSPEPSKTAPLLPTSLLKSKPTAPTTTLGTQIDWDSMSQKEKKALRDELGVSMRELRDEAQRNGVIDAGKMAQLKRGIRPAEKVAGGRVVKKRRAKGRKIVTEMSGKQRLIEQRARESRKRGASGDSGKSVKKRKG